MLSTILFIVSTTLSPVIVMDLDETVIDSIPRRFYSMRRALGDVALTPKELDAIASIEISDLYRLENRYDLTPIFQRLGIPKDTQTRFEDRATAIYLSGFGLEYDVPMAGADRYVRELRRAGARIIFVSSRYDRLQRKGTEANLIALGMIAPSQVNDIILRPEGMSSIDFKRWAFSRISGNVVGIFENEPENMNAMIEAFPNANAVFVTGAWIHPGTVPSRVTLIQDFTQDLTDTAPSSPSSPTRELHP